MPVSYTHLDVYKRQTEILKSSAHKQRKCVVIVTHSNELTKRVDVVFLLRKGILTEESV